MRSEGRRKLAPFLGDAGLRLSRLGVQRKGWNGRRLTLGEGVANHDSVTQGARIMRSDKGGACGGRIEFR